MTKKEAKEAFGMRVRSPVRLIRSDYWRKENIPTKGLLVGVRTYSNAEFMDSDGQVNYLLALRVALIVPNLRQNPIQVPLKDCELVKFTLNERL